MLATWQFINTQKTFIKVHTQLQLRNTLYMCICKVEGIIFIDHLVYEYKLGFHMAALPFNSSSKTRRLLLLLNREVKGFHQKGNSTAIMISHY